MTEIKTILTVMALAGTIPAEAVPAEAPDLEGRERVAVAGSGDPPLRSADLESGASRDVRSGCPPSSYRARHGTGLPAASCAGSGWTGEVHVSLPAIRGSGISAPEETPRAPSLPPATASVSPEAAEAGGLHGDGTSPGGRRISLRPVNNRDARDLLDHWGRRAFGPDMTAADGTAAAVFRQLLESVRQAGEGNAVRGFQEGDAFTMPVHRHGGVRGRWTGGPADRLSIEFNLDHATDGMRDDMRFRAMLERAGKVWSRRIADTWTAWERREGERKADLIVDYGLSGETVRVGPGGETSTGLVIYVTGAELSGNTAGLADHSIWMPGDAWEPHAGAIAFDNDYVEDAEERDLFATMVHEIGHVLGSWLGEEYMQRHAPYTDFDAGTWTGPNVVAVHGGPAPFQDGDDAYGWHDGERSPDADSFDFAHGGVCDSVMAYCGLTSAVPVFLPAEIDFAFLRDLGLTVTDSPARPETYGLADWMDHSAFTLSVSRELEVSLAWRQPRFLLNGDWSDLDTVDLLWAEADAFGNPSAGDPAAAFSPERKVSYAGRLIGAAVDLPGLPPVLGDASLSFDLESLDGKASFTSLRVWSGGNSHVFGDGSLHYPLGLEGNGIRYETPGTELAADFYGPEHSEVAGTLDDSRAGLFASFGARRDGRPTRYDVIADASHVRGMMYQNHYNYDDHDGWYRYRCGSGSDCEARFDWWKPDSDWYDVTASEELTPRERVLDWTAGWGEWLSEDMFADHGGVRIVRRRSHGTDGGMGRRHQDGYYGTMEYAAFGAGVGQYLDYEWPDGDVLDHYIEGAGFQGDLTGSRPAGGASWDGRMVGYQSGLDSGEDPFVQGHARIEVSFDSQSVDIGFSGVASMDLARGLPDFGFGNISLSSDGTFDGFDGGPAEGGFFGPAHQETAGMFRKNDYRIIGSFGAVARD